MFASGDAFLPQGCVDPWAVTGGRDRLKPLVMAVHGRCYTLAIELALATDCVVAADDTNSASLKSRGESCRLAEQHCVCRNMLAGVTLCVIFLLAMSSMPTRLIG